MYLMFQNTKFLKIKTKEGHEARPWPNGREIEQFPDFLLQHSDSVSRTTR